MAQRVSTSRLQVWAAYLMEDQDVVNEVRDRFQTRMLERFRMGDMKVREQVNAIMDNEAAFFEELQAICDEIRNINTEAEEDTEPADVDVDNK